MIARGLSDAFLHLGQVFPVPLSFHIFLGDEAERGAVDTVAEAAGLLWPIRENMT